MRLDAGDVAARPRQAGHEPDRHRIPSIAMTIGIVAGRLLGGQGPRSAGGHDDVDLEPDQLGWQGREPLELPVRLAVLDDNVLAVDVAEVPKSLSECLDPISR